MSAFDADIDAAADEAGVPRVIFRRLIGTESGGDPLAVSPKGARGLAQLMPDTAADLERRYGLDTGNPKDNLRAGARYLREQYDAFGGDWRLALNAYNFGPGNLRAHLKAGGTADDLPAETRGHEQSVLGPRQAHRFLTAAVEPIIVREANRLGDDMTLAQAGLDIAMGVGTGFVLGGAHGTYRRWRGEAAPARATQLPSVKAQAAATALLDEATQAIVHGERPHLSPASLAAAGETLAREADIRPAPVDADPAGLLPSGMIAIDPGDRQGLVQWIRDALATSGNQLRAWLGAVSDANVRAVADQAGVDIAGYSRVWEQSSVRHVDNRHGPGSIGVRHGELPITPEEMALYREIVDAPDGVERTVTDRGQPSLLYEKKFGDWYYYVEEVRAGRRTLALVTMYRRPTPDPTKFGRRGASGGPDAPPPAEGGPRGIRPETTSARTTEEDIAPPATERQAPGGGGTALSELEPAYHEPGSSISPTESIEPPPAFDPKPETAAERAESMGLDLAGARDLDPEVRQLQAEGRLDETATAELAAGDALVARADGYARAYEAAAGS